MKRPGVIPPGKAGIFLLAAAMVPVLLKEAKPLVRAVGRGFHKLGDAVDRLVAPDEVDQPRAEAPAEPAAETPPKERRKKKKKPSTPKP